ncbi:MAG: type II toxin-antitoxin system VapC family toxin [Deltaproteobacteria bacterium]|nr:type II toxin-antitoxin system VapC family toxin [Deltaproteobacteria bacterium]
MKDEIIQTVLIDTDIVIDFLRGKEDIKDLIVELWKANRAFISILTVYELYAGIRDKESQDTEHFIDACTVEFVTLDIAEQGGELFRKYRKQGKTLSTVDCLIMATAMLRRHKILTRNIKHYPDNRILYKPSCLQGRHNEA